MLPAASRLVGRGLAIAGLLAGLAALSPALAQEAQEEASSSAVLQESLAERQLFRALRRAGGEENWPGVVVTAEQAAAAGQDSARLRLYWIQALIRLGRFIEAERRAEEGLAKFADDALSLTNRAQVHLALGEHSDAGQAYWQAVQQDPNLSNAHLGLARIYESERRMTTAKKHLQRAYELDPDNPAVVLAWAQAVANRERSIALVREFLDLTAGGTSPMIRQLEGLVQAVGEIGTGGRCLLTSARREQDLKLRPIRPRPGLENRYALMLSVDGSKPVRTLVDTGAAGIVIGESLASDLGLEPIGKTVSRGLGKRGWLDGSLAVAERLQIQDLVWEDCIVDILPDTAFEGADTPALMGLDAIYRDFVIEFDFTRAQLGLSPLPPLPTAADGWPDLYSYDRDLERAPEGFMPARIFDHDFVVPVLVDDTVPTYFIIDSGASTTVIAQRIAVQVGELHPSRYQARGISGEITNLKDTGPLTITLLGFQQRYDSMLAVDMGAFARGGRGFGGLLGYPFLQHAVVTFDSRNALVRVEKGRSRRRPSRTGPG